MLRAILLAWALIAAVQLALWLIQQRTKNGGIVDVGWAGTFCLAIAVFACSAKTPLAVFAPMAAVVVAWSLRLTAYLVARGAATGEEEGRYADLRQRWAPNASRNFFVFFQAQAALTAFLSLSLIAPFFFLPSASPAGVALRWLGTALSFVGVVGESVADRQLDRFRRDARAAGAHGRVCDVGLWAYSRHPNYFFEWFVWVGHALHCFAYVSSSPLALLALSGQALIFLSIWKVTGIPATEAQALRTRGDAYRAYQARVSAFVPWPPKRGAGEA